MDVNNLIRMANQIGEFFETMPDQVQAKKDIAAHIRRFWEPRMRKALLDSLDQGKAETLSQIAREALQDNRQMLA